VGLLELLVRERRGRKGGEKGKEKGRVGDLLYRCQTASYAPAFYQKSLIKIFGEVQSCGFPVMQVDTPTDGQINKQTYSPQSILQKSQ